MQSLWRALKCSRRLQRARGALWSSEELSRKVWGAPGSCRELRGALNGYAEPQESSESGSSREL
eukprot:12940432-Alexandrium_andersonii.AAC.1